MRSLIQAGRSRLRCSTVGEDAIIAGFQWRGHTRDRKPGVDVAETQGSQSGHERRDLVDRLRDLAVLRDKGVLNEAEFQRAKLQVLAEYQAPKRTGRGVT